MRRRQFLQLGGFACFSTAWRGARNDLHAADSGGWRIFEVTTAVEVLHPAGRTQVWVPVPLAGPTPFQRVLGNQFDARGGTANLTDLPGARASVLAAEWPDGVNPALTLTSRVATRDVQSDPGHGSSSASPDDDPPATFLRPTRLIPTDGIVRATADRITRGARNNADKVRAIYEWVVDNTARNPKTRGCGLGDIRFMLETGDLSGKCADLNALFVGLARAAGVPARDVYGLRVAASRRGFKSLGVATEKVTRAQHCRAEVFLNGWVPVDPADVRKVMLEEPPGNLPVDAAPVRRAREQLFGSWEMNWVAYNDAHDVRLPGSSRAALPFFMYPECDTGNGPLDSLDPDSFRYEITAREVV